MLKSYDKNPTPEKLERINYNKKNYVSLKINCS